MKSLDPLDQLAELKEANRRLRDQVSYYRNRLKLYLGTAPPRIDKLFNPEREFYKAEIARLNNLNCELDKLVGDALAELDQLKLKV